MTRSDSISFDRAPGFYDKTRSFRPEIAALITDQIERELRGRSVLEVGIGTGRIALPLNERGIEMTGLDLSRPMLDRLIANAGGTRPFPLVQGDATSLPFTDGAFSGGIVSWVLHLVAEWQEVLRELVRVMTPGGVVLVDVGGEDTSLVTKLTWKFKDFANVTDWPRGVKSAREAERVLTALGAKARILDPVHDRSEIALEDHIAQLEQGVFSVTWGLNEETRRRAADELRRWAEAEYGTITEPLPIEFTHVWHAFDL